MGCPLLTCVTRSSQGADWQQTAAPCVGVSSRGPLLTTLDLDFLGRPQQVTPWWSEHWKACHTVWGQKSAAYVGDGSRRDAGLSLNLGVASHHGAPGLSAAQLVMSLQRPGLGLSVASCPARVHTDDLISTRWHRRPVSKQGHILRHQGLGRPPSLRAAMVN